MCGIYLYSSQNQFEISDNDEHFYFKIAPEGLSVGLHKAELSSIYTSFETNNIINDLVVTVNSGVVTWEELIDFTKLRKNERSEASCARCSGICLNSNNRR